MRKQQQRGSFLVWGPVGVAAGAIVGAAVLALTGAAGAAKHVSRQAAAADSFLMAAHFPLKLRATGEPIELRYDIYCTPPDGDPEGGAVCDGGGTVYVRADNSGTFTAVPLRVDSNAVEGRYVAVVPATIAGSPSGFQYYAVLRDNTSAKTTVLPAGGPVAPQRSLPLGQPLTVDLGTHTFGAVRQADRRVVSASWGTGPGQVGLEAGADSPVGGSSFDVNASGTVFLLDEANKRVLRFAPGADPAAISLPAISGVAADLSVGSDATIYVLDEAHSGQPTAVLRSFDASGTLLAAVATAEANAPEVRLAGNDAYVSQYPSSQWMPVIRSGAALDSSTQVRAGSPGRPIAGAGQVVVVRTGNEVRAAVTNGTSVVSSARVLSDTPVADVQLAQTLPSGDLVLVFSVYTETQHEYEVLVSRSSGIVKQFAVPAAEWAEASPLSRFRLVGSSLYELGSTPSGVFVDRYDLGVS